MSGMTPDERALLLTLANGLSTPWSPLQDPDRKNLIGRLAAQIRASQESAPKAEPCKKCGGDRYVKARFDGRVGYCPDCQSEAKP